MFLRFVVRKQHPESRSFAGLFAEADELKWTGRLEPHESERLEAALRWFDAHLAAPRCLYEIGNLRAISWFKPVAAQHLKRAWEIVSLLREHGVPVEMIKSTDPGTVVYQDRWQVTAKPRKRDRIRSSSG